MSSQTNTPIDTLRTLHRIHRQLADLRGRQRRGPNLICAHQANVKKHEQQRDAVQEEATKMKVATDAKQGRLKDGEEKINKLKTQMNTASSNREYQGLKEQIAATEMANSVLADEILEGLERLDEIAEKVVEAEAALAKTVGEAKNAEQKVREEEPLIAADIGRLESELAENENMLEGDFKTLYLRISKVKGEETLAPLKGEYCNGCSKLVPLNNIANLMLENPKPVVCSGCGRILYVPEDWKQK